MLLLQVLYHKSCYIQILQLSFVLPLVGDMRGESTLNIDYSPDGKKEEEESSHVIFSFRKMC
jgi:hypothetical protein